MAKAYKNEVRELNAQNPRPIFSNAYDYYIDYYWVKLQKRDKSELELQISVNFFSVVKSILQ